MAHAAEAHPDATQESAIRFIFEALSEGLQAGGVERIEIILQPLRQRGADRRLLRRTGEQVDNQSQLLLIVGQQMFTSHPQCFPRGLRRNVRIAIAVAADP